MVVERWNRFWFAATPLTRLAAFRIVIATLALYDVVGYARIVLGDAAAVSSGGPMRTFHAIYSFEVLGLGPIGEGPATAVFLLLVAALALTIVGLATRPAALVAAILFVYWSGLAYSFGKPHHEKVALAFAVLALPFAPVGARLSADSLWARYRRARRGGDPAVVPRTSEFAGWPLRLTQVTVAVGYFFAGASKLYKGGLERLNGYTLQGIMMGHDNDWSGFFSASVDACRIMSVGLVAVQVTFPLVLVWPAAAWVYVPLATSFHLLTWKTMDTGPYMTLWLTMAAAFVPLERVPGRLRAWLTTGPPGRRILVGLGAAALAVLVVGVLAMNLPGWALAVGLAPVVVAAGIGWARPAPMTVIYDGGCGLCRRALAILLALDWCRALRPLDLQKWEIVSAEFPWLDREACLRDMHAVSGGGRTTRGFDAYRAMCPRLPVLALFTPLLWLPPVAALGRAVYRRVADRRHRDGCGGEVCSVASARRGGSG